MRIELEGSIEEIRKALSVGFTTGKTTKELVVDDEPAGQVEILKPGEDIQRVEGTTQVAERKHKWTLDKAKQEVNRALAETSVYTSRTEFVKRVFGNNASSAYIDLLEQAMKELGKYPTYLKPLQEKKTKEEWIEKIRNDKAKYLSELGGDFVSPSDLLKRTKDKVTKNKLDALRFVLDEQAAGGRVEKVQFNNGVAYRLK